jgi:hypothetical protein
LKDLDFQMAYPFHLLISNFVQNLVTADFVNYIPMGDHPDSWLVQNKALKQLFNDYLNPPLSSIAAHIDLIKNAELFAMSENGEFLFWDIQHPLPNGEFPIYFTDFAIGVFFAGNSIAEMIETFTDHAQFKSVLKFYENPLIPCFEGF